MTKEEFIDFYYNHTYIEMQNYFNTTPRTIAKIAKQLGLTKPVGRKREIIQFVGDSND